MVERTQTKDRSIQSLRGVAIVLMVAGHVIGSGGSRGMTVADDSAWRFFYIALEDIRMPLFTVISGYVYALRPVEGFSALPSLVRGKARRLLIPLVTVGVLLFALQVLVPGTNSKPVLGEFPRFFVFTYQYGHLWFLQSVFLIFLTVAALDAWGVTSTRRGWGIASGVALLLFVMVRARPDFDAFGINGYFRLLPFFLLGYGIYRYRMLDGSRLAIPVVGALFLVSYSIRTAVTVRDWDVDPRADRAVALAVGMTAVVLIYSARRVIDWGPLAWIGGFSFGIYLLHVFGSAASRLLARSMDIDLDATVFVIGLLAGVGLPIVFQIVFGRWNVVRVGILGEKPRRTHGANDQHPRAGGSTR